MAIVKKISARKPFNTLIKELPHISVTSGKKNQVPQQQQNNKLQVEDEEKSFEQWLDEMMNYSRSKTEDRLLFACSHGSDQISVQLLSHELQQESCPIPLHKIRDVNQSGKNNSGGGCSLLHICAKQNKVLTMEYLFKNEHFTASTVDIRDHIQATPLLYAVGHNSREACAFLLSHGANPNSKDSYNKFPLLLAMKNKNYEMADLLLPSNRQCDLHLKGTKGNTVLHTMAQDGDLQGVKFLMEKGASPLRRNSDEEHVLFSCMEHLDIIDYICRNSKSNTLSKMILYENAFGRSVLHESCCSSSSEGNTHPLQRTSIGSYLDQATTLTTNKTVKVLSGLQCLFKYVVVESGNPLSDKQVNQLLNNVDHRGDTPLLSAVKNARYDLVEFLCQCAELELDEPDLEGQTALSHASGIKDKQMSAILTKYGASVKTNKERERENNSRASIHSSFLGRYCFSIRTGIMVAAVIQVLICCFAIWITSFTLSRNAQQKTSHMLMEEVGQKVQYFINEMTLPTRMNTFLLADAYEMGNLPATNASLPILFSHAKQFKFANIALGEEGRNVYLAVITSVIGNDTIMLWQSKEDNMTDMAQYSLDKETGEIIAPYSIINNYVVTTRDWYKDSIGLDKGQGRWGDPFWSLGLEGLSTYFASPMFYQDKKVGLVKNNLSLTQLGNFLMTMELLGRGYALIVDANGNVIASSVNLSKYMLLSATTSVFNVTERNMGKLARVLYKRMGGSFAISSQRTIGVREGGEKYDITVFPYNLDNMRWTIMVVFYDSDLYRAVNIATYVTVGITIVVLFLGVALAMLSGFIMTQPLIHLQRQFNLVANMDLDSIKKRTSLFSEIAEIYESLDHMTVWLKEFRAFLPDSVLLVNNNDTGPSNGEDTDNNHNWNKTNSSTTSMSHNNGEMEMKTMKHRKKKQQGGNEDTSSSSRSGSGSGSGSSRSSTSSGHGLHQHDPLKNHNRNRMDKFKLGLSGKTATVLVIGINNQEQFYNLPPVDIVHAYSKFFSACSTLASQSRGILQVLPQTLSLWVYFDGHSQESRAVQTALDLIEYYTTVLNQQLLKERYPPLEITCGIDTSYVLAGNIGVANMRLFSIVGTLLKRAEQLQLYCYDVKLKLLVSENTWNKCQLKYTGRPVDVWKTTTMTSSESSVAPIYEIVSKVVVSEDQWVHELDNNTNEYGMVSSEFVDKKWSQEWNHYMNGYYTILNGNISHLEEARLLFEQHLVQFPKDIPTLNWISVINRIQELVQEKQELPEIVSNVVEKTILETDGEILPETHNNIDETITKADASSMNPSLEISSIQYLCTPKIIYQKSSQGFEL